MFFYIINVSITIAVIKLHLMLISTLNVKYFPDYSSQERTLSTNRIAIHLNLSMDGPCLENSELSGFCEGDYVRITVLFIYILDVP